MELVVACLDLSNAFNSAPHSSNFRVLEDYVLHAKSINTITSLYGQIETRVKTVEGVTVPIQIRSGVKQGSPLSPDVFNLLLELGLRGIAKTGAGYTIEGQRV